MEGMTVIELANVLAGPSVGQFLAELGARVIKVESPVTRGDVTRTWKLPNESSSTSSVTAYFSSCNLGKESMTLNLSAPGGCDILYKLVDRADVLIASFKPGDEYKLKVDFATLSARNPRLIYAQITGYGLEDKRPGYDAVIQAEAGFQYINGPQGGPPCKLPVALMDVLTAHQLKAGILLELWRREHTGRGAFVSASLFHSAVSSLVNQAGGFVLTGRQPEAMGSDHPSIVPYGTIFQTAVPEQEMTVGVGSNGQFKALCRVLGVEELGEKGSRFETNELRCKHREELKELLQARMKDWGRKELLAALTAANVPCGGINRLKDVFETPQAQDLIAYDPSAKADTEAFPHMQAFRKHLEPVGIRQITFKGNPEGLQDEELTHLKRPPEYGASTDEILREFVECSDAEIEELRRNGVV